MRELLVNRGEVCESWRGSRLRKIVGNRVRDVCKGSDNESLIELCKIPDRDQNAADITQTRQAGDVVVRDIAYVAGSVFTVVTSPATLTVTLVGHVVDGFHSLQRVTNTYGKPGFGNTESPVFISSCGQT